MPEIGKTYCFTVIGGLNGGSRFYATVVGFRGDDMVFRESREGFEDIDQHRRWDDLSWVEVS